MNVLADATHAAGAAAVTLTDCDREPIHVPGAILPHGAMLVADPQTFVVEQAAGDTAGLLGIDVPALPGLRLEEILTSQQTALLGDILSRGGPDTPLHLFDPVLRVMAHRPVDASLHLSDGAMVIEFEDADLEERKAVAPLISAQRMLDGIDKAETLPALCDVAAERVRRLVRYDHVMIYRFMADATGCVCAESRADGVRSFLDLHFPAGDIPHQARALYLRSPIRLVTQVDYQPAPLLPAINPRSFRPLDMSLAILRDVSPIHREYLRNMGVAASMSISIVVEGQLWGLIACHHRTPRRLPRHLRAVCEVFGSMFSLRIEARLRADQFARRDHSRSVLNAMLRKLAEEDDYAVALGRQSAALQSYVSAGGLVIHVHGGPGGDASVAALGAVPECGQIKALTAWLSERCAQGDGVFATDRLGECYPDGKAFAKLGSGVLALSVSRVPSDTIIWFRPECIETVRWGGNPAKTIGPRGGVLTPRASFSAWAETVRGRSLPWTETDLQAAADLRLCLMDIVLRRIESQHRASSALQADIQRLELQNTRLELENRVSEATRLGQEALTRSEARFRAVFESGPKAMVLANADGAIEMTNGRTESLFGYGKSELAGKMVSLLIPEFSLASVSPAPPMRVGGAAGAAAEEWHEASGRRKDGAVLLLEVVLTRLETFEGHKIVAAMSDIRGRLELEAELRQAQKMEAVGRLTAGVAHDFNNLLQTLVGSLELLQESMACADSACAGLVETSIETAMRGARLTHHLLAFSRKQMLRPSAIDVAEMLEKMLPLLQRTIGPNIRILHQTKEPGLHAFADAAQLETCVLNLVLNARDAMAEGGCVTLSAGHLRIARADNGYDLPAGEYTRITIQDTGHGIPAPIADKVFEPFFTTKPIGKGSGLGLSMVMGFARQSGGAVKIDTDVGRGTRVDVVLPCSEGGARHGTELSRDPERTSAGRILLVDDVADVLATLGAFLTSSGFDVVPVRSADEAIRCIAGDTAVDMIVTDYAMPDMNGADLLLAVSEIRPAFPGLIVTGYPGVEDLSGLPPRFKVLRKPFLRAELLKAVNSLLSPGEKLR